MLTQHGADRLETPPKTTVLTPIDVSSDEVHDQPVAGRARPPRKSTPPAGSCSLKAICHELHRASIERGLLLQRIDPAYDDPYRLLDKSSNMLGFRGHFSTKSRRYSVTLGGDRVDDAVLGRMEQH